MQLVLGLEVAIRALGPRAFKRPSKWSLPICIGLVVMLLLAHVLAGLLAPPADVCFASLFWLMRRWAPACFGVLVAVVSAQAIAVAGIVLRLQRDKGVTLDQRVAASRVVYHLVVGMITVVSVEERRGAGEWKVRSGGASEVRPSKVKE